MMYVLYDGTPMLRLPDGTGLSREDCQHWSKLLRKAAADLKRPAFQSVSHVRVDGLTRFFSPQARDFNPGSRTSARRGRMWDMRDDIGKEREAE